MNKIEVRQISKTFLDRERTVKAVDQVSFDCEQGQIFGLLGPNGAGKTTTIRIITTLLTADCGSVAVDGVDVLRYPEQARARMGVVSADLSLYSRMTARELMRFVGRMSGMADNVLEERIEEVLTVLQMASFADVYCEKLSSGMKQRASLARAVVHDPAILILDEPTASLDVATKRDLHSFMLKERDRGKTILFSTHSMDEAQKLCDRLAIISGGQIEAVGTMAELRSLTGFDHLEEIFMALTEE